ncbi:MAG TPA: hypothetical protein VG323_20025, partial [Thermoanaerobaculia bacterium]|nr:hypothetical protein [Thermoanaerobaculia bacterium]
MRNIFVVLLAMSISVCAAFGQTATAPQQTTTAKEIDPNEPPGAPPTYDSHDPNAIPTVSYVHGFNRKDWK